ncbi:MAG: glutathione peroxidase [Bacteroidales bacterium]|jgi:glutathione peroxidase|nr:glutathione peroxidase [Bacteroidales bacterium]MDD4214920.1 glutathione peroxidase [Bacteroidales bacterium]
MRTITLIFTLLTANIMFAQNSSGFYMLKAQTLDGNEFDFSILKGKKVMIVNTASKCGYTPQYKDLEELHKKYGSGNFVILGFPSNDFMNQEPLDNEEIKEFCSRNYGVTFQMMSKVSVTGKNMDPVYQWLTDKKLNGVMDSNVKWNFQKYLIDKNGKLFNTFASSVKPFSESIVNWINGTQ